MLNHRPDCAVRAAKRYAEYPKLERLDALRPHLRACRIFARHVDHTTAPIKWEHLKALVRKWKLHHERNFWRNHPDRESVVLALFKAMKARAAAQQRQQELEALRLSESAADRLYRPETDGGATPGSATGHGAFGDAAPPDASPSKDVFEGKDLFGVAKKPRTPQTEEMLVYKSRGLDMQHAALVSNSHQERLNFDSIRDYDGASKDDVRRNSRRNSGLALAAAQAATDGEFNQMSVLSFDDEDDEDEDEPARKAALKAAASKRRAAAANSDSERAAADAETDIAIDAAISSAQASAARAEAATAAAAARTAAHAAAQTSSAAQTFARRKCAHALLNMSISDVMAPQFADGLGVGLDGDKAGGGDKPGSPAKKTQKASLSPLPALLQLTDSVLGDEEAVTRCAACLINVVVSGFVPPLAQLQSGASRALGALSGLALPRVSLYAAAGLAALSAAEEVEHWLIEEGATKPALALLACTENPLTMTLASRALVNLAANLDVGATETLAKNVMRVVVALSHERYGAAHHAFCASVIERLSCLPAARAVLRKHEAVLVIHRLLYRIVQEGGGFELLLQAHGHAPEKEGLTAADFIGEDDDEAPPTPPPADPAKAPGGPLDVRYFAQQTAAELDEEVTGACSIALCNLTLVPACRKQMVDSKHNIVQLMCALLLMLQRDQAAKDESKGEASPTRYLISLCLTNLSASGQLRLAMLREGALESIAALVLSRESAEDANSARQASRALLNFAYDPETRDAVVSGNALLALIELANPRREADMDVGARWDALCALCNLLADARTYEIVVEAGTLDMVVKLASQPDVFKAAAKPLVVAMYNSTCHETGRMRLVDAGGLQYVIAFLAAGKDAADVACALAALHNCALDVECHAALLAAGLLSALGKLASKNLDSEALLEAVGAVLHSLSCNEKILVKLLDQAAVALMARMCASPAANVALRGCTAAIFFNFSQRRPVTESSYLPTLMGLANSSDNDRVLRSSMAFSNLSTYPKGRATLGKHPKVIPCLCDMMRSGVSDAEKIQYHCAMTLCNSLSVYLDLADLQKLAEAGTVHDLIVITLLRVNEISTKQVLAKALFNLLAREDTRELMTEQGVPDALVRLTRIENHELNLMCVKMLMNYAAEADRYVHKFIQMNVVSTLITQCTSAAGGLDIKRSCGATLAALSFQPELRQKMIAERIVVGARAIAVVGEPDTLEACAALLYNLSAEPECREELAAQAAVPVVVSLAEAKQSNATTRQLVVATLCNLSCNPSSHQQLVERQTDGTPGVPMLLLTATIKDAALLPEVRLNALKAVCNLVCACTAAREVAVECELTIAMGVVLKSLREDEDKGIVATILREMSTWEEGRFPMLNQGAMNVLLRLAKLEEAALKHDVATALANLSACPLLSPIVEEGCVECIFWLTLQDLLKLTRVVFIEASIAMRRLCQHSGLRSQVVVEEKFLNVMVKLANFDDDDVRYNVATSYYHALTYEPAQKLLARKGITAAIIDLAGCSDVLKEVCGAALHNLPSNMLKAIDKRMLDVLMSLLEMKDASFVDAASFLPNRDLCAAQGGWDASPAVYPYKRKELSVNWPTMVVERAVSSFLPARIGAVGKDVSRLDPASASSDWTSFVGEFDRMAVAFPKQVLADLDLGIPGYLDPASLDDSAAGASLDGTSLVDGVVDSVAATELAMRREEEAAAAAADGLFGSRTSTVGSVDDADASSAVSLPQIAVPPPPSTSEIRERLGAGSVDGEMDAFEEAVRLDAVYAADEGGGYASMFVDTNPRRSPAQVGHSISSAFATGKKSAAALPGLGKSSSVASGLAVKKAGKKSPGKRRKKTTRQFVAAQRTRQKDRIGDDYMKLLQLSR